MYKSTKFKTPSGEGEDVEILVPARVLQVFTDLMFTQQGRVQDDIIKELQSIHERVQLALRHFGMSTKLEATPSEMAEEEMRRRRPPGFQARARREEMLRKRNILDTIHEILQICARRESILDEVSDWLYDVQLALEKLLSTKEEDKAYTIQEMEAEKQAYLVYNDGKRFYKKLNEKFKKVAKDIFETMSGMSQPQEGEQYQEYSEDSTGNKGKVLDIASNRLKALSAKLQNNRKAIQGKNLLAEAENWRVASIEVKKGLEDALRTCRTNNDRITMKSALKQFNFMNLAMERRISENADLYEEILEHEVKINHLEKLNERMDEESKKKSSRVTGLEKHVEKVNAKLNEMKNKQKQMKTEMEKVKNAKVTQAAQAEIDKALATVNAQMEDVKAKAEQDIKLLNEKIETQEKEFQEKVASLEAEVEDCQSTITKLNIALDNLDCQLNDALDKQDEYANRLDVTENQSKAKQSRQESIREQYKDQLKNYKREVDTLEKELESMKQDMKSKEELIQTQEEKIAEILAQLKGVRRSPVQPAKDFAAPGSPNEFKQYIARLKSDYDHEIHMLQEHNAKEKLRSEAAMRRMTQEAHAQLNSIHKESLVLLRAINRFKDSTAAIFDKEGLADIGHEIKQMQNLTTDERPTDIKSKLNQMGGNAVELLVSLELKLSQAFMNKRLELKEALMPKQRSMAPAVNSEVNAEIDKLTKENETLNEKLEKSQELIVAGEYRFGELKRINDEKYQALLDRHKGMILHSSNLQRELKQLEEAFRKEMKKRDSKLRSMRGSLAEQARNHQVLVNRLEMSTVPEEPEKPDISQLKLKVKDQMKNLEMLQGALKENKISLELHTITVDIINQAMEVPEMRLRQMFERYIMFRRMQDQKENMLEKIEDFANESDNKKEQKLASFLERMETKVNESLDKWKERRLMLKQERTKIYEQLLAIFDAVGDEAGITMIRPAEKLQIVRQPSKRRRGHLLQKRGVRMKVPMEFNTQTLTGKSMTLLGDRGPYWKVSTEWEGAAALVTVPRILDLDINTTRNIAKDTIIRLGMGDMDTTEEFTPRKCQKHTLPPVATLFPPINSDK
ncbi:uncharacterized protein [Apostichopus japonicus]